MDTGEKAPDFTLPDETGTERTLSVMLEQGPIVLYFYPAAMTPGCTAQGCHFRDLADEFEGLGARRVGISPDDVDKQARFAAANNFDFPLLSDRDGVVAHRFGVRRRLGPVPTKRRTFVLDTDRTVLAAFSSELRMKLHGDRALQTLRGRH